MGFIDFSIAEIAEFVGCPVRYKLKFVDKVLEPEKSPKALFEKAARVAVMSFAVKALEGEIPSKREFRNAFGKIWYHGMTTDELLFKQPVAVGKLTLSSIKTLDGLYDMLIAAPGRIVAVGMAFDVPVGKAKIQDVIPVVSKSETGIDIWCFRSVAFPSAPPASMDYGAYVVSYGFRSVYRQKESQVLLVDISSGTFEALVISKPHYERLFDVVESLYYARRKNIFYPRPGAWCRDCSYSSICIV